MHVLCRVSITDLISESLPAHARNVSNWLFGWLIQALKKLNSPNDAARALASLYTGSNLTTSRVSGGFETSLCHLTDRL